MRATASIANIKKKSLGKCQNSVQFWRHSNFTQSWKVFKLHLHVYFRYIRFPFLGDPALTLGVEKFSFTFFPTFWLESMHIPRHEHSLERSWTKPHYFVNKFNRNLFWGLKLTKSVDFWNISTLQLCLQLLSRIQIATFWTL